MTFHLSLGRGDVGDQWGRFDVPIHMTLEDLRRHTHIMGETGTGKSTFLSNLFAQLANAGIGCLFIDPHGDQAPKLLNAVPANRIRKTVYLNPSDRTRSIGFNLLDNVPPEQRPARAAEIVSAFRSLWGYSWGPRLERILSNTILALLDNKDTTLLSILMMLTDTGYRNSIVKNVSNPAVALFWEKEFPLYNDAKSRGEALTPVLNKVGDLFSNPAVCAMLGQPTSTIHPRHLMDNNYLVIADLSKGLLGEGHVNLLGALLLSAFGSAAMSRANIPAHQRKDFVVIIDEFHNFTTSAFKSLLAESRKYGLSLVLAHQYLDQLSDDVRSAILGSTASKIAFRIGPLDAKTFATLLDVQPHMMSDIPTYKARAKIVSLGRPSEHILLTTPPPPKLHGHADKIIAFSRTHFAKDTKKVNERIAKFLKPGKSRPQFGGKGPRPPSPRQVELDTVALLKDPGPAFEDTAVDVAAVKVSGIEGLHSARPVIASNLSSTRHQLSQGQHPPDHISADPFTEGEDLSPIW